MQLKSQNTPKKVSNIFQACSNQHSTFNRLSSFISWGVETLDPLQVCENGFFFKENVALQQFDGSPLEIQEISAHSINEQRNLETMLGRSHPQLKALFSENVPLARSINYMTPVQAT